MYIIPLVDLLAALGPEAAPAGVLSLDRVGANAGPDLDTLAGVRRRAPSWSAPAASATPPA